VYRLIAAQHAQLAGSRQLLIVLLHGSARIMLCNGLRA
jgi:hypothetical protein